MTITRADLRLAAEPGREREPVHFQCARCFPRPRVLARYEPETGECVLTCPVCRDVAIRLLIAEEEDAES